MKNQTQPKKIKAALAAFEDVNDFFAFTDDDSNVLTAIAYLRLDSFGTGEATLADRQICRIRLVAGLGLLELFEYDSYNTALINRAIEIVYNYRTQIKRDLRKIDVGAMGTLREAMLLIDRMVTQTSLWDQVMAYKKAEDACLIGSNTLEYVQLTVH